MNQITTPPASVTQAGLSFNYAVWPKDTIVDIFSVPWNNDYRDVVKFASPAARDAWMDGRQSAGVHIENISYMKPDRSVTLDIPFNAAMNYNYLRAKNPLQPITSGAAADTLRNYYYFVTDVQYVAPDTTRLVLQLDVFTTFQFDATFGNCYIEAGHIGIANTHAWDNYGRDYLTIPEGLDVGSEYQVIGVQNKSVMAADNPGQTEDVYNILVVSAVDLQQTNVGDVDHPILPTAKGGTFAGMPSGASQYVWKSASSFSNWLATMQMKPWITQGIISITAVPPVSRYFPIMTFNDNDQPTPMPSSTFLPRVYNMWQAWRDSPTIQDYIPARYRGLKKLFTFPYMAIELTTFTGTPIIMKPEAWQNADARVVERINIAPPAQRVAISPFQYNAMPGATYDGQYPNQQAVDVNGPFGDDHGEYIDLATYIQNFPTLAIVNNGAIAYLAANANGIAFQYQNADWSQQRALYGNQVGYDQASAGMNLTQDLTNIGIGQDTAATAQGNDLITQKAILGSVAAGLGGGVAGVTGSGSTPIIGGLASGAAANIGAMMDKTNNLAQLGIRNAGSRASTNAQVGTAGYVRDTNKNLADYSARGDYANAIAGINAKVRDAQLIQPTTSGQVGGDAMNLVNNNVIVSFRIKMIDQAGIRVAGEYFLRYGYKVHKFSTPPVSLQVMSKFTYWKMQETYLTAANMPESYKQVFRGIFEKGVTVWADPSYIGVTDIADNQPLAGVTL